MLLSAVIFLTRDNYSCGHIANEHRLKDPDESRRAKSYQRAMPKACNHKPGHVILWLSKASIKQRINTVSLFISKRSGNFDDSNGRCFNPDAITFHVIRPVCEHNA